uniref:DUF403 domain-containing protein n=1 Tax=uncultured bacterium 12-5D TaxID=1497524 RepID=A0A059TYD7_9BACT|nr:hypothetical protein 5d1 [uncultured bacterium 12-5D]
MLQVVQSLEAEELNSEERKLYRPIWIRLLPRLEGKNTKTRRNIRTQRDRYSLMLNRQDEGSVITALQRAFSNATSIQDCLSPESWNVLDELQRTFGRHRYKSDPPDTECARRTRLLSESAMSLIPQFFAVAQNTMLSDDGWRFCQIGLYIERALTSANAVQSIFEALSGAGTGESRGEHATEIQLSAFLRLLGTRDAYRRVYQVRAQPQQVLEMIWQNPEVPRSVMHCLNKCRDLLEEPTMRNAPGTKPSLAAIKSFRLELEKLSFRKLLVAQPDALTDPLQELLSTTEYLHFVISDSFLSHQAEISTGSPRAAGRLNVS